ncbi:MAG: DUF4139 domain-containing protein [Gammaproteobacteria bacterium]|nr:DUF4139 domain-containing protein [Gammaproteobacteria bacterium]
MSKKRARSLPAASSNRPLLAATLLGIAAHASTGAAAQAPAAAAASGEDVAITIYSSAQPGAISPEYYRPLPGQGTPPAMGVPGYAMVRQERAVQLGAGRSQIRFTDVAALIDPTTVTFTSLTDPATRVLEQNFQFDLVSTDKLLLKYIDRPITVERNVGGGGIVSTTGTLLSSVSGLVLRGADGNITALNDYASLRFPELPGGLITRPTLVWDINAGKAGTQRARVTYQTGGVTWWSDYNLIFNAGKDANNGFVDLSAWVSIINQSGATFQDAKLKLIAGDVHRAPNPQVAREIVMMTARAKTEDSDAGFAEKAFDEFHLYTLGRKTTLPNNSTKQIELFDQAKQVPARRLLVLSNAVGYFGGRYEDRNFPGGGERKVDAYLEFRNDKASGLGVPLPAGRIRVSRLDAADSSLEFIGEDVIDHTPRDEKVRIQLGSAFDVVGERKQVDFTTDSRARWIEEEIEVEVRNHKDEDVEVQVREFLFRWTNWRILSSSQPYEKEDASTILFPVKVPKDSNRTVKYRVRYSW